MGEVVSFIRNVGVRTEVSTRLEDGMILPAAGEVASNAIVEHAAEPIKNVEDIARVTKFLVENKRYRDNMLFILGINFGLRISDLLRLRFCDLIDDDLNFRTTFPILEKKTRNTRKVKRNRYITINEAVMDAVRLYLQNNRRTLSDYVFVGESNRCSGLDKPLDRTSADRILKGIAEVVGLKEHISTHSLRKTFGYHQMMMSNNDPRKLLLLQKIFGHSSVAQTLDYIGITEEEISDAYLSMNLGHKNCYRPIGMLVEDTAHTA